MRKIFYKLIYISALTFHASAGATEDPVTNPARYLDGRIFDWHMYAGFYPELGLTTRGAAENHWLQHGIGEGRQGNASFHTVVYRAKYATSLGALGTVEPVDYVGLARHYVLYGQAAQRVAPPAKKEYSAVLAHSSNYPRGGESVVGNEKIKIYTSARFAGAIWRLWYNGVQIIDDTAMTYGRLLQFAGWKHGYGPCLNFIEAGSQRWEDSVYPTGQSGIQERSSKLLNIIAGGHAPEELNYLRTAAIPALFRRTGDINPQTGEPCELFPESPVVKRDEDSKIIKRINMSYGGDPHIVEVDLKYSTSVSIASEVAGKKGFIFQFYAALLNFDKIYKVNLAECHTNGAGCVAIPVPSGEESSGYLRDHAIIAEHEQGGIFFALYQRNTGFPQAADLSYVGSYRTDGSGTLRIVDTSANLTLDSLPANDQSGSNAFYGGKYYIVIGGTLDEVRAKVMGLAYPAGN